MTSVFSSLPQHRREEGDPSTPFEFAEKYFMNFVRKLPPYQPRSLAEFCEDFEVPKNPAQTFWRNVAHFQTNYIILFVLFLSFSMITHGSLLVAVVLLSAIWILVLGRDKSFFVAGNEFDMFQQQMTLTAFSVLVLFFFGAIYRIGVIVILSAICAFSHAYFRVAAPAPEPRYRPPPIGIEIEQDPVAKAEEKELKEERQKQMIERARQVAEKHKQSAQQRQEMLSRYQQAQQAQESRESAELLDEGDD
eukprot:GFYU01005235.1.p1 GENE.GFYU01005235.1~~GFYU01005235.1.p1  ORF type:complete len:249 (-),score=39.69 GFYU01005235.1:227-973(-)